MQCPLCAKSGHRDTYSITSSAMATRPGGKVRPSAFAVLRLITNSNLFGCTTGRSVGLAPLRIFPVVYTHLVIRLNEAGSVAHQASVYGKLAKEVDRRYCISRCQCD